MLVCVSLIKRFAFEFTRPEIKGGPQRCFAMRFGPNSLVTKRHAKTALQNALKDHILDFGPGKLRRKLL